MVVTLASVWPIVKIALLFAIGVYIVFALVVYRQVSLMVNTLEMGFELPLRLIAIAHLLFAVGVFLVALTVL